MKCANCFSFHYQLEAKGLWWQPFQMLKLGRIEVTLDDSVCGLLADQKSKGVPSFANHSGTAKCWFGRPSKSLKNASPWLRPTLEALQTVFQRHHNKKPFNLLVPSKDSKLRASAELLVHYDEHRTEKFRFEDQ